MGRPPIGPTARTIKAQVKINAPEQEYLILTYGSVYRGLRALIDNELTLRSQIRARIKTDVEMHDAAKPPILDGAVPLESSAAPTKTHRHKREQIVRTDWDSGMRVDIWACACGEELR